MCPPDSKRPATVADHIEPHRDDYAKFWFGALQSLCAACHDIKKQRQEARGVVKKSSGGVRETRAHKQIFPRGSF